MTAASVCDACSMSGALQDDGAEYSDGGYDYAQLAAAMEESGEEDGASSASGSGEDDSDGEPVVARKKVRADVLRIVHYSMSQRAASARSSTSLCGNS